MDATTHLMSPDLLDACGTAPPGGLHLIPDTAPEQITCPACRALLPQQVETTVDYLCLGHPAWPGNLTVSSPEQAQGWLDEHRDDGHPIYVVKRTTTREPFAERTQ